jgi:two-component system sensor histidine kinase YesM
MLLLMLVCWLLPVAVVIGNMGYFIYNNYHNRASEEISGGLATGLRITADQLNGAVSDILRPGYDGTIRDAWLKWSEGGYGWTSLYDSTIRYLRSQYQRDARFPLVAFWFAEAPEDMRVGLYIEEAGGSQKLLTGFWQEDYPSIRDYAPELGTYTGFYRSGERIYLVRNLMDSRFQIIGTQALALDMDVFTEGLSRLTWGSALCLWVDGNPVPIRGETPEPEALGLTPGVRQEAVSGRISGGGRYYYDSITGDGYTLSALLQVDRNQMLAGIRGYQSILLMMALLLGPMLLVYYRLYERNITAPMRRLMAGAAQIEGGDLGYQMRGHAGSMEFRYVIDAFNSMSGQLRAQFEHIYREELSLRDARIKALQSQINPHFLNNTLEIINWEARIGGNAKVSQMIEALSTLLDAAMDRDRRQEVRLAEELRYINAYLFIIDQRFGKRLTVIRDISPDALDCMVPRLILQPVVENAVEHGIGPAGTGQVALRARLEPEGLVLEVENDGVLSEEDRARIDRLLSPDYDASRESSYSLGIANVNQRLRILYGPKSGLSIFEREGGGIIAKLVIARGQE